MIKIIDTSIISNAAEIIKNSNHMVAFTGAGISVESGIPPFRGEDGLWNKYDPRFLDIRFFREKPLESWRVIKEVFYDLFEEAEANRAHLVLAELEKEGLLKYIITQNIDSLHHKAGNKKVYEFHGNSRYLKCMNCNKKTEFKEDVLADIPPCCSDCGGLLKPDFVFFGEGIPEPARTESFQQAEKCDLMLVIGTTGEVQPASFIPHIASQNGATIIEVNIKPSLFTDEITDIYLEGKASVILDKIYNNLK